MTRRTVEKPPQTARALATVFAVAILALLGTLDVLRLVREKYNAEPDPYRMNDQLARYRDALQIIPPGSVVGYFSDVPFEQVRGAAIFFGAQYALAPRLLVPLTHRRRLDYVIGNFAETVDTEKIPKQHRLTLVKEFENGVVVFRPQGNRP